MQQLIDAEANINHQDGSQYQLRPIHWAARNGHLDSLKQLLEAGVDIDSVEGAISSAIFWANFQNEDEIAQMIIDAGGTE